MEAFRLVAAIWLSFVDRMLEPVGLRRIENAWVFPSTVVIVVLVAAFKMLLAIFVGF